MRKKQTTIFTKEYIELIKDQFSNLQHKLKLDVIDEDVRNSLIAQSVHGRVQSGHAYFQGQATPWARLTDIMDARGLNIGKQKALRQELIDEVPRCLERLLKKESKKFVNEKGLPLYRVGFLEDLNFEYNKESFKGMVLASRMDSFEWRTITQDHYKTTLNNQPLKIGSGKEYLVNIDILHQHNLSVNKLAKTDHCQETIQRYRQLGIIVDQMSKTKNIENAYIRRVTGKGTSDDACLIGIGLRHGLSAMDSAFVVDATDTYGKLVKNPVHGGHDEAIGEHMAELWEDKYKEKLVSPEECIELIYFGHKANHPEIPPSNSHRRFIEITKNKKPSYINHRNFVKIQTEEQFRIGFEQMPSNQFYNALEKRIQLMKW